MNTIVKTLFSIVLCGFSFFSTVAYSAPEEKNVEQKKIKLRSIKSKNNALSVKKKQQLNKSKKKKRLVRKKEKNNENHQTEKKEKVIQEIKKKEFSFYTAFPDVGDMDVLGKQLLDGALFCVGLLRVQLSKEKIPFKYIGNNNLVGNDGFVNGSKLLEETRCILGGVGVEFFLQRYADTQKQDTLYFFPVEASSIIRKHKKDTTIFYRQSYQKELKVLAEYVIKTCSKDKIAILYESGLGGRSQYEELLAILDSYNLKPVIAARYAQGTVEIDRALKSIMDAAPNVIFCLAKPRPAYKFIKQAIDAGLHSMLFVGPSPLIAIQLLLKNVRGVDVTTISVVPPETSEIELVKKYKKAFAKRFAFKRSNPFYLETFLYLSLMAKAFKEAPKAALEKPELLVRYFEQFKNINFWGLPLTFDPETRSLATKMWIAPGADKPWIEVAI